MRFSSRITKILCTSVLGMILGSVVLPAGIAFAQVNPTTATTSVAAPIVRDIPETPVTINPDHWALFRNLFATPVTDGAVTYISGINTVAAGNNAPTGIKEIRLLLDLAMDKQKSTDNNKNTNFYYDATAAEGPQTFFIQLKYKDINGGVQKVYKNVPDYDIYPIDGDLPKTNSGIYYNKKDGALVTGQKVLLPVELPETLPYKSEIEASFWYCGGVVDSGNNSGNTNFFGNGHNARVAHLNNGTRYGTGKPSSDGVGINDSLPTPPAPDNTTTNPNFKRFTTANGDKQEMCGGTMAYRIGTTKGIVFPDQQSAVASSEQVLETTSKVESAGVLPTCGIVVGKGTFMGCIALIVYHIFFRLAAVFAYLMGNIFDFFLGYSISSNAYIHPFVTSAWETVRDIANIFFIILLIYVAIGTIVGIGGVSKKLVGTIILNAILINFSLLITRGVIDISNIAARVFYAQIHVQNPGSSQGTVGTTSVPVIGGDFVPDNTKENENSDSGYKGVSAIMLQSFDPQRIFDKAIKPGKDTYTDSDSATDAERGTIRFGAQNRDLGDIASQSPEEYAGYFALVTLICAFIAFFTGLLFWQIGFIFIGRVVGLYIAMIFSPFAFMSRDIPFLSRMEGWAWGKWWDDLIKYAIVAPITVVYFYIVIQIMQTDFYSTKLDGVNQSFTYTLLWIVIPLIIIYGLLIKGKEMIIAAAGDLGKKAQSKISGALGTVGGAALGVASGGVAFAGRNVLGRVAASMQKGKLSKWTGEVFERNQNNKYFGGLNRFATKTLTNAQTSSFDLRQNKMATTGLNKLTGQLGIQNEVTAQMDSKALASIKLGTNETKGGIKAQEKRGQENANKDINSIQTNAKDAKTAQAQWQSITKMDYKKNQKKYISQAKENLKAQGVDINSPTNATAIIVEAKKLHQEQFKNDTDNVTVYDNASLTEAMRQMRARKIKENPKGWLSDLPGLAGYETVLGKASTLLGGATLGLGAAIPAVGVVFGGYTETEARKEGATENEKNRKKLFDEQNEIAEVIKELRAQIEEKNSDSYNADLAEKFAKNKEKNGVDYAASDELIDEAVDHHTSVLKEDLKSLQDELKNLKNKNKGKAPTDEFKKASQKLNQDIAAKNKKIKTFSNIKPKRENIKKKFEEQSKPKEEKKDK